MADIIRAILAGPEVDNYHKVSNDFTSTEEEVKYVNELTKLLTEIATNPSLNTYLENVENDIKEELADINEADLVVAKLVADETNIDLSSELSDLLLKKFQESTTETTTAHSASAPNGIEQQNMSTSIVTKAAQTQSAQKPHTGNASTSAQEQSTEGVVTVAAKNLEGNYPVLLDKNGNPIMSGGFRKTNKRRNNKGRKRSKGTRKK